MNFTNIFFKKKLRQLGFEPQTLEWKRLTQSVTLTTSGLPLFIDSLLQESLIFIIYLFCLFLGYAL